MVMPNPFKGGYGVSALAGPLLAARSNNRIQGRQHLPHIAYITISLQLQEEVSTVDGSAETYQSSTQWVPQLVGT